MHNLIVGSRSSFQDTVQNLKMRRLLCAEDWWLVHHQSKTNTSMKSLPSSLFSLHRSHLIVRIPISQICRTSVSLWDLLYFWWNANCLSNSSPWIQMLAMYKRSTFPISQNVVRCLLLHLSRIVFAFFALDHTPCARMICMYPNDNSDSVSSFSITNWCARWEQTTGLPVLSYFSACGLRGLWLSCQVFPGLSDAAEDSADGALSLLRAIKFFIGLDFAVTLSSPDSFFVPFEIISEHSAELKWLMWNKHKRWFHSSRVKFPLVSMSASWFLVSMYLIWILESKLIRSNNQSRAARWVLETWLIVGLLPFMIILITASLSSNTYNKASWCEHWTFEGTRSTLSKIIDHVSRLLAPVIRVRANNGSHRSITVLSWFWVMFPRTKTTRSHKSRAGILSNLNPASKEMISDSVELCETVVGFLHIQLFGTNVWLPKTHNVPPEVDFESSRSPAKSESWNSPSLHCFAVLPT